MAICSPQPRSRYVERTTENDKGGIIGRVLQSALNRKDVIADMEWDAEFRAYLDNVLPFNWQQLEDYFVGEGWLKRTKKKDGTIEVGFGNVRGKEEGMAAAVTKTYLESVGGGIQQLANNFLMKVKAGDPALQEGLELAKQMQHASRFSSYVLGWDQSYGQAVRAQGLRNNVPGEITDAIRSTGATAESAAQFTDEFQEIAKKLNGSKEDQISAIDDLVTMAKRVQFADSPMEAFRISGSVEMAGNAWREVWINGLLSGPATAITNMTAVSWAIARPMGQYATAQMYAAAGLPGASFAKEAAAEAAATITAMYQGLRDGLKLGWQAYKTETSIYAPLAGTTELASKKAITSANANEFLNKQGWNQMPDEYAEMFDTLAKFVRMPSRILLGSDEFVKHLVIRGEVASQGVKRAAKEGIDLTDKVKMKQFLDEEYGKAFKLDMADPRDKWAVQRQYEYSAAVRQEANVATFQEQNGFASWVQKGTQKGPGVLAQPFIPFVRTPLNILKQGFLESTGAEALWKAAGIYATNNPTTAHMKILEELLNDPGESFRVAGQMAMTGTLAAGIYAGVMSGQITGGGPGRWMNGGKASDQQRAWEKAMAEEGRTKYSVMVGGQSVPFERFGEPVAVVLRMVADVAQYSGYMSRTEQDLAMTQVAGIMVSGLYQASFLTGVDNFMAMFNDNERGSAKTRAVQNYVSTQTPFGGLLNYVDKVNDPYRRAYEGASFEEVLRVHENGLGLIFGRVADRMPGMGGEPLAVDQVSGEPIPAYYGGGPSGLNPLQLAIPFAPRGVVSADKTWSKIYDIMGTYTEARPTGIRVTGAEQSALNAAMAQQRINGLTFSQWVDRFYARADVKRYVENKNGAFVEMRTGIENEFNRMKNQYFDAAFEAVSARNPNLYQRRALYEAARVKARNNDLSYQTELNQIDELLSEGRRQGVF